MKPGSLANYFKINYYCLNILTGNQFCLYISTGNQFSPYIDPHDII